MELLKYLNYNFNNTRQWDNQELITYFFDVFGVNVKVVDCRYMFKYDMLAAKWCPVTFNCRGTILVYQDTWKVMSRPWDKFFNQHEGHSGVHNDDLFNNYITTNSCHLAQKADGTAIQMYWNFISNTWDVSTLGNIETSNVYDNPFTFGELFWNTVSTNKYAYIGSDLMDKDHTWLFELCTKYNRIVTKYDKDCLFLVGIRNNETGEYEPVDVVKSIALRIGCECPDIIPINAKLQILQLSNENLQTLAAVKDFVEYNESYKSYGEYPEGYVLYNVNGIPVCKMKNANYIALHHIGGGDKRHAVNCVIDAFFTGTVDDIYNVLDDDIRGFLDALTAWYVDKTHIINTAVNELSKMTFETQKDYALYVLNLDINKTLTGMFFENKNAILSGTFDNDIIAEWFKNKWHTFEKEIKTLWKPISEELS